MAGRQNESYPFYIWSGLLKDGHCQRMGMAVWTFMWCIDKTTTENPTNEGTWTGKVLGGNPVTAEKIAEDLKVALKTVKRHINILRKQKYIKTKRTSRGLIIEVLKSKKGRKRKLCGQPVDNPKRRDRIVPSQKRVKGQKCPPEGTKVSLLKGQKCPFPFYKTNQRRTNDKTVVLSQIENLLKLFPESFKERIEVYWQNAACKNKTRRITNGRKVTLLRELYNSYQRTDNRELFEHALEQANRYRVAHINYVNAIIRDEITKVRE